MNISRLFSYVITTSLICSSPAAAEDVSFMLDWLPSGDKAAAYYGVSKGYFKEQGLNVTITSGRGSSDVVTKLATGVADLGIGGLPALLQARAQTDVPVKVIMSIYTMQPDAIFTQNGSGIVSLKDLVGKTVATATFSSSNVTWPVLLKHNNIDPASIKLIKADPGALAPMLATGRVDATISWLTMAPAFEGPLSETGKKLSTIAWSDAGFSGYGLSLMASDKVIAERPDMVRKFATAFLKSEKAALDDPQGAAEALKSMIPEVDVATAQRQWEVSIPLMKNPLSDKDGFGAIEPGLLATTWKWVAEAQGIKVDTFDPATAVNAGFLP